MRKLRRWMIRKLGGYTEQTVFAPPVVKNYSFHPVKLRAEVCVGFDQINRINDCSTIAIEKVKSKIAEGVLSQGLLKIDRTDNPETGEAVFSATAYLITPSDAALCGM